MAIKKIPCGGFSYDDSEITFENGVIRPIGGGSNDFNVVFSWDDDDNIVCDKTYEEIYAAISAGKNVHGFEYNDDGSVYSRYDVQGAEEDDMICFIRITCSYAMNQHELTVHYYNVWSDNGCTDGWFSITSANNSAVIE